MIGFFSRKGIPTESAIVIEWEFDFREEKAAETQVFKCLAGAHGKTKIVQTQIV